MDVGGSPAPDHLHDHTDRARHLAPSRGPGLGEAASRGATLPRPLEDMGEAALQTRPARGWPVSLTVMNHGRGLAQEGPGCRAGGWGTNTRQEGGREGREGRRASDRTEHGLGTPQPKDGATGTGDKQDCAWTGVTELLATRQGFPGAALRFGLHDARSSAPRPSRPKVSPDTAACPRGSCSPAKAQARLK